MPTLEVDLPDRIDADINHLIEQGEFVNQDQAVEELLSLGVSAYGPAEDTTEEPGEDLFTQRVEDQQDPAAHDTPEEDPTF
jgi:Arc/MetJ-type ribon-helix-helix transcriptional regulator